MAEKYDLTSRVGAYLDRHLVFPLLEFLSSKEVSYFGNSRTLVKVIGLIWHASNAQHFSQYFKHGFALFS